MDCSTAERARLQCLLVFWGEGLVQCWSTRPRVESRLRGQTSRGSGGPRGYERWKSLLGFLAGFLASTSTVPWMVAAPGSGLSLQLLRYFCNESLAGARRFRCLHLRVVDAPLPLLPLLPLLSLSLMCLRQPEKDNLHETRAVQPSSQNILLSSRPRHDVTRLFRTLAYHVLGAICSRKSIPSLTSSARL